MILFKFDVSQLIKRAESLNRFEKTVALRYMRQVMEKHRPRVMSEIHRKGFNGRPGLVSRTGRMFASVKSRVTTTPTKADLGIFSTHPGIGVQVHGATITPKVKRKLAIPFSPFDRTPPSRATHWVVALPSGVYLKSKQTKRFTHSLRDSVYVPGRLDIPRILHNYVQRRLARDMVDTLAKNVWTAT